MKKHKASNRLVDILLVEDNPEDAELSLHAFNTSLEKITPKLWHVKDGAEALQFIFGKIEDPDINKPINIKLIILDIKMPKVDGFEVLSALRNDERTKDIPVIILTSSKEKSDLLHAHEFGIERYIVKPILFEEYVDTISEIGAYWKEMNLPIHERIKKVPIADSINL